jgi:hypothetical protein
VNTINKDIFSGLFFVSGAYLMLKYANLPKWIKKNVFKIDTIELDGKISETEKHFSKK